MADPKSLLYELVDEHGEFVRKTKHGGGLYIINGQRVVIPGTAGDYRAWNNSLADVKRAIQESDTGQVLGTNELEDEVSGFSKEQMQAMGIHVGEKRVIEVRQVATLTLKALSGLLGLSGGQDDGDAMLALRDVNGNEVEGPIQLIRTMKEEEEE